MSPTLHLNLFLVVALNRTIVTINALVLRAKLAIGACFLVHRRFAGDKVLEELAVGVSACLLVHGRLGGDRVLESFVYN
jgi:hypothetical protein